MRIKAGIAAAVMIIAAAAGVVLYNRAGKGNMAGRDNGNMKNTDMQVQSENVTGQTAEESTAIRLNEPESEVSVKVDLTGSGQLIKNKFSDINQWDMAMDWISEKASGQPENYIKENYPFVKRVQLMTATGGTEQRDLFSDPKDRTKTDDYDFSPLGTAIGNIIRQGLTPYIVVGNVPVKYCSEPYTGGFGVNVRPPDDYNVYYKYVKALAEFMVERFGADEVRTWTWRALVEYENKDWFSTGNPETTREAYFKLYDYTVAALEEVIGAEHLYIGAHSMTNGEGFWDEREFIDHVAFGTNYCTGKKGTQIDFLSFSYYDIKPGFRSPAPFTLEANLALLRDRAIKNGLTQLQYGVDEGRIASGKDGKELYPRTVASSYQAAYDAKLFKQMHDIDLDYFSTWYLNSERIWGEAVGINPVGTHLANLTYRMAGAERASLVITDLESPVSGEVDGIASYSPDTYTAQVLLYNLNEDQQATAGAEVKTTFENVMALQDGMVKVKKWVIDDDHANYWPKWEAYLKAKGVTADDFGGWSGDSWTVTAVASQKVRQYWYSHLQEYHELSELKEEETMVEIKDGKLALSQEMKSNSIVYYEISKLKIIDN